MWELPFSSVIIPEMIALFKPGLGFIHKIWAPILIVSNCKIGYAEQGISNSGTENAFSWNTSDFFPYFNTLGGRYPDKVSNGTPFSGDLLRAFGL